MKSCARRLVATLSAVLVLAAAASAQAPSAPMAFTISTPDPASHLFHVQVRCDRPPPGDTVEFRMPAWTPGYYGLFDFAGNVRGLAATDGEGRPLPVTRGGPSSWIVRHEGVDRVILTYDVLAASAFVANAFLDETRAYILPGALFVYLPGELRRQATVTIELNPRWSTVATGLEPVPGASHTYAAADFDVLYDSPVLIGNLESLPVFHVRGVPHRFVGHALGEFDRPALVDDLRAIVEAGTRVIGDIPYKHYTFLAIGPGRGGIEHANSAAVSFSGIGSDRASRLRTLSFLAHEYFHHYNVKRIRPAALGPFDYDRPNVTDMLWVSEGFTVYYEYLMLARSGRMTAPELLEALGRAIAASENTPGRLFQSATTSSRDTWAQGPFGRGNETGVPRTISYYDKGAVLALLLDLRIRHETGNARSLDTVMRALYQQVLQGAGEGMDRRRVQARLRGGRGRPAHRHLRVCLHDPTDRLRKAPGVRGTEGRAAAPPGRGLPGRAGRGRRRRPQRRRRRAAVARGKGRPGRRRRRRVGGRRRARCRGLEGGHRREEARRAGAHRRPSWPGAADDRGDAGRTDGAQLAPDASAEAWRPREGHPGGVDGRRHRPLTLTRREDG